MADPQAKPDNQVVPNEGSPTNPDQVTIGQAELDSLRSKGAQLDKIAANAKEADYDNPEQYTTALENELQRYYVAEADKENAEPATDPDLDPAPAPAVGGLTDADKQAMKANDLRSAQAFLEAQKTAFTVAQMNLPATQRSKVTDNEMLKVINDKALQPMVRGLAGKFGGNVYAAAAHYLTVEKGIETARQEGIDSQAAMDAAAGTASLGTGGTATGIAGKTVEEKAVEANNIAADDIAPDDPPFEDEK